MILQTIAGLIFDYMVANGYNKKYELVWLVHEPEKYKKYQAENVKFVRNFKKNTTIRRAAAYRYALTSAFIFTPRRLTGSEWQERVRLCKSLAWLRLQGEQEQPQGNFSTTVWCQEMCLLRRRKSSLAAVPGSFLHLAIPVTIR